MSKVRTQPKEVWVIFDPMDGPHVFRGKKEAFQMYNMWGKEAEKNGSWDSFWGMSEPVRYVRGDL